MQNTNDSPIDHAQRLYDHLCTQLQGQNTTIRHLLATLLAQGHALLEDLPGTGKTTLAKALAYSIESKFARIQFTPDLMPSDITGTTTYNPKDQLFVFHPGAVFSNVLLSDEINRASPRTQSALLEAMEERQISNEGKTLTLPEPFFVIATENPVEMHGTFPLPEAQLDRFMTKLSLGYVSEDQEVAILKSKLTTPAPTAVKHPHILDTVQLIAIQKQVRTIHASDVLLHYITQITRFTRKHPLVKVGASARGSIALLHLAQALAFLDKQTFVTPKHVQEAAPLVLAHRLIMLDSARIQGQGALTVIQEALHATHTPV